LRDFLTALNQETIEITNHNIGGLAPLCAQFGSGRVDATIIHPTDLRDEQIHEFDPMSEME
jgi:hypothetical protein